MCPPWFLEPKKSLVWIGLRVRSHCDQDGRSCVHVRGPHTAITTKRGGRFVLV